MKKVNTKKIWFSSLTVALFGVLTLTGCSNNDNDNDGSVSTDTIAGYLYTTTNGEDTNKVVQFSRHADGSLSDEKEYTTNSKGGANIAAGGDAHGDFDSQGAVQIIGDYLLTVNAGGNEVSVFNLNKENGDLTFKNNVDSGGTRPVSIAYTKKAGSTTEYWVVVGNQWNNPNVQKDGDLIERYPSDDWFNVDLTAPDASDAERNIQLFSFNSSTGVLSSEKQLDTYVRANGGPTTVSFSKDGTKLAVSTWGIAHFGTDKTSTDEQRPSRVYVYDFASGNVSNERYFEEIGIAGSIGFNWSKTDNATLFVSNFNLIPTKLSNSVTVLNDNGSAVTKIGNAGATNTEAINEACWTILSPTGDKLYVASFATNLISSYNVSGSTISFISAEVRKGTAPAGDSKDMWISSDNKFLYNTGAFQSFSINTFEIGASGTTYKSQTNLTSATGVPSPGKYNFLGLIGFDK